MPRSITIRGRRWFQKSYGNTYYTASIFVDGKQVHSFPESYGYGDQYEDAAWRWLAEQGYVAPEQYQWGGLASPRRYCQNHGITYLASVSQVARERDLRN